MTPSFNEEGLSKNKPEGGGQTNNGTTRGEIEPLLFAAREGGGREQEHGEVIERAQKSNGNWANSRIGAGEHLFAIAYRAGHQTSRVVLDGEVRGVKKTKETK